jgi:hypothetical protein
LSGFTSNYDGEQQHRVSPLQSNHNKDDDNALIPGLLFLGGSKSEDESEFRFGNIRVRLQTNNQGFVLGVGRGSVSVLRIVLRFTLEFVNGGGGGLDGETMDTQTGRDRNSNQEKRGGNNKAEPEMEGTEGIKAREMEQEHSLSLSLTMTITIMAVNTVTLS